MKVVRINRIAKPTSKEIKLKKVRRYSRTRTDTPTIRNDLEMFRLIINVLSPEVRSISILLQKPSMHADTEWILFDNSNSSIPFGCNVRGASLSIPTSTDLNKKSFFLDNINLDIF